MPGIFSRRLIYSLTEADPKALLGSVWHKLAQVLKRSGTGEHDQGWGLTSSMAHHQVHPFDKEFGTDTGGLITGELLSSGSRNAIWNTAYYGIAPSVFDQAFGALNLEWPRFTLIDLGSGKGRALLLASRLPFRSIEGVELDGELNDIATANIQRFTAPWQVCTSLTARTGDAAHLHYPATPLVLFLYHPFLAPVLKQCLKNLARSLSAQPRETYLVYVNPIHQHLTKHVPAMTKLWERVFNYSQEDAAADRLSSTGDRVSVWRYMPRNQTLHPSSSLRNGGPPPAST